MIGRKGVGPGPQMPTWSHGRVLKGGVMGQMWVLKKSLRGGWGGMGQHTAFGAAV